MRRLVPLMSLGLAAVLLTALTPLGHRVDEDPVVFVATAVVGGLVAVAATRLAGRAPERAALTVAIVVGVAMRIVALAEPPLTSTDVYRYVWDGRVQGAGIDPYRFVPADPALAFLRDAAIYPNINRADYAPTIYPPVAQFFFFLATRLGDGVDAVRLSLVAGEVGIVALLATILARLGRSRALVVGWLWHPLVVWEIANAGHVDGLAALLVVAGTAALVFGHRRLGVVLVVGAALVKPPVLALLPAFWRRWEIVVPLVAIGLIGFAYAPHLAVGSAVLGFLPGYLREEGLAGGNGFWLVSLVRAVAGDPPGLVVAHLAASVVGLVVLALRASERPARPDPATAIGDLATLLFVGLFVLSPNYPWYYLPLVPFAVLRGGAVFWTTTILAPVLHLWWPGPDLPVARFLLWKSVLNGAWITAFAVECGLARLRRAAPPAVPHVPS